DLFHIERVLSSEFVDKETIQHLFDDVATRPHGNGVSRSGDSVIGGHVNADEFQNLGGLHTVGDFTPDRDLQHKALCTGNFHKLASPPSDKDRFIPKLSTLRLGIFYKCKHRDIPINTTERPAKLMMNEFSGLGIVRNQKTACSEVVE